MILDKWQRVSISRIEQSMYLYLEGVEGTSGFATGPDNQLSLSQFLWVGGVEDMTSLPASLAVNSQFHGCVQKVSTSWLL